MTLVTTLPMLLLSVLLLVSTDLRADDSAVKQLEVLGSYPAAIGASDASSPAGSQTQDLQRNADELTHDFNMKRENNKVYEIVILGIVALVSLFMVLRFLTAKTTNSAPHIV